MSVHLKLKPPQCLPAEGVTAVEFKVWKNRLLAFVEQDFANSLFLPGGIYSEWNAKNDQEDGKRLRNLVEDGDEKDEEVVKIDAQQEGNEETKRAAKRKLLQTRNSQLSRFLQHIANYTNHSEQDDIVNSSTSVAWVWRYLEKHYNIET